MALLKRILHAGSVYDAVQHIAGAGLIHRRLRSVLAAAHGSRVLDAGAGTGLYMTALPANAHYIWYDHDVAKLNRFETRRGGVPAVLGDVTKLAFADKSVDWTLCINVTHHLADAELDVLLSEICRVTRQMAVIHDPLATSRWASRLLWRIDRGSHPRTDSAMRAVVSRYIRADRVERFGRFHQYLLLAGPPR